MIRLWELVGRVLFALVRLAGGPQALVRTWYLQELRIPQNLAAPSCPIVPPRIHFCPYDLKGLKHSFHGFWAFFREKLVDFRKIKFFETGKESWHAVWVC